MPTLTETAPEPSEIDAILALYRQGHIDEVENKARAFCRYYPDHGFGWKILGVVLYSKKQHEQALVALQKAVELLPGDHETHCNLGIALIAVGRFVNAEASFRKAIILAPDSYIAHYNLGIALLSQDKPAEACFRRALEIKPDFAAAFSNLLFSLSHNEEFSAEC